MNDKIKKLLVRAAIVMVIGAAIVFSVLAGGYTYMCWDSHAHNMLCP